MALELNKVHHYVKEPGGRTARLVRTNPLIRFSSSGQPVVFLQGGVFYYEGGESFKDLPGWLKIEIGKCDPRALREAGYVAPPREGQTLTSSKPKGRVNLDLTRRV